MRRYVLCLLVAAFSAATNYSDAADARMANQVHWYTNYNDAVKAAKASSKPLALLFTGSDWCTWCIKLEQEALMTREFADTVKDRFVFVKLDFPMNSSVPAAVTAQNKQLQQQFGIPGFPTIVILDPDLKKIGTIGYEPGGGKKYGMRMLEILDKNGAYQQKLGALEKLSGTELKSLYLHADELRHAQDADEITLAGIGSDQAHFFLLERYRLLSERGDNNGEEAAAIKQRLLADDPNNIKLTWYQVAVIDFEARSRELNPNHPAEFAIASLVDYINKFGEQDKDNVWQLQMIIAQVFMDQDKYQEALQYAQSSYKVAPPTAQLEIAAAIKNLQSITIR